MQSQGLLFSEPSVAETGVWCELSDGIDPADWAGICRHIGSLNFVEFQQISAVLMRGIKPANRGFLSGIKRFLCCEPEKSSGLPIVSIGPGKPGGSYQWEL